MKKVLVGLLCCLLHAALAAAQPVTGSGTETAWLAPQAGMILDVAAGKAQPVSMGGARRVPDTGWLAAQLRAGEPIWVHLDGDPEGKSVRFGFLSGGADAAAVVEVKPEPRGPGDFVLTAPVGPPTWLGLSVRPGHSAPRAQIWVGAIKSPAYRWELWEELAKKWAAERKGPPPPPPDVVGEPLVDQLALIQDAVALAQAESPDARAPLGRSIESLLRAEALLAAMPAREPVFPYYRRKELTNDLGKGRPQQKVEGLRMAEVKEKDPARFTIEGPCILRIEARARFEETAPFRAASLLLQLRAGSRLLQVASEEVTPRPPEDAGPPAESGLFSSQRRLLLAAPPGRHTYELKVRGVAAWVSVITHSPVVHLDDAASHAEDVPRLLARAQAGAGSDVLTQLVAAEASFLKLEDDKARAGFQRIHDAARSPRLRAFAQLRLAALAPASDAAKAAAQRGLDELAKSARPAGLGDDSDEATRRVRDLLVVAQLVRVVADLAPGTAPPADAVDLLKRTPEALPYMLGLVGPLLRYVSGYRSQALPLLAQAQKRSPLDVTLRHTLAREWFTGTRFTALPTVEMAGAKRIELLSPPHESITCTEATAEGIPAYAPLPDSGEAVLQVPDNLAPPQTLHRFQLVSLRSGPPRLGFAELVLDGERTSLPLVLPSEHIPMALAAGRHTLRVSLRGDQPDPRALPKNGEKPSSLLGPCALQAQSAGRALLVEQRFSALGGRGSQARVVLLEPGTPGFLGLELRASPALRGGRLVLRTDQGVLGTVEVSGHGRDDKAVGEVVGPSVVVVLPVPAATRLLDIVREDNGAPLLVAARLRRSLAGLRHVEPRLAERERDADKLEELRRATRALREAKDPGARSRARLHRADTLIGLDAPMLARNDLDHAMPALADDEALAQARALMASTLTPPLLPRPPQGPAAVLLAAGAGLTGSQAEITCATGALLRFAGDPLAGRSAAASCAGVLGQYVAARLEEQGGAPDRAAQHYSASYLWSVDAGQPRPALAREAALRFAERGPGPGSQHGLALAVASAQDNDLLGGRAIAHLQGLSHLSLVRGVDAGLDARIKEPSTVPLSLRAALMDVPWTSGQFMELRAGKSAETNLQISRPVKLHIEALCDDGGEVPSIGPPCSLRVEADGAPAGDGARVLRAGERGRLGEVSFGTGPHRIKVTLERRDPAARAFVHVSTSRPLAGDGGRAESDGYYSMSIAGPPVLRFTSTADEPVKLRAQGSTVLRIDALAAAGSGARALAVELALADQAPVRRVYPVCTPPAETPPELRAIPDPAYDCRSLLLVPLIRQGTYQITLRPVGSRAMALAMSVYEDEPAVLPFTAGDEALASLLPDKPITEPESPVLATLPRPMSNAVRALGTLQVQQLGVFGSTGRKNPQIGDTYGETSIFYRRRLDNAPVWFRAGTALRLRSGSPSFGVEGLAFGRIPVVQLRLLANLQSYTQSVEGKQEYAVALHSYVERSFALIPHLFLLPRFAFTATYQSLAARPTLPRTTDGSQAPAPTPIDLSVFNIYDAAHPTGIYGQLIVWGVPFINMITYGAVRLTSNRDVHQLDSVSGRLGVDLALRTTELVADYEITQYLVDDARSKPFLQHRLSAALKQTVWLHRNHRLGLLGSGYYEATSQASVVVIGAFWEGSPGRGLDDYATPEINLPQQLSQGRNALRPEETLR